MRKSTFAYYPSGAQTGLLSTETVDPDNELHKRITTHEYDAFGNRIKTSVVGKVDGVANQTRYARWGYDTRGRFVNAAYLIQDLGYAWDGVGNLTSRRDQGGARDSTEAYTYDTLNRLRTVTLNGTQTDSTTYDAFGNLKTKTGVGNYGYDPNRPHAVTSTSVGNKTYSYDLNGNMVTDSTGRTLAYASFDKPTSIVKGSRQVAFGYGPAREVKGSECLKPPQLGQVNLRSSSLTLDRYACISRLNGMEPAATPSRYRS